MEAIPSPPSSRSPSVSRPPPEESRAASSCIIDEDCGSEPPCCEPPCCEPPCCEPPSCAPLGCALPGCLPPVDGGMKRPKPNEFSRSTTDVAGRVPFLSADICMASRPSPAHGGTSSLTRPSPVPLGTPLPAAAAAAAASPPSRIRFDGCVAVSYGSGGPIEPGCDQPLDGVPLAMAARVFEADVEPRCAGSDAALSAVGSGSAGCPAPCGGTERCFRREERCCARPGGGQAPMALMSLWTTASGMGATRCIWPRSTGSAVEMSPIARRAGRSRTDLGSSAR